MKKVALTGWGTWWHSVPLHAMYTFLKENRKLSFIWVGEKDSLEEAIATENGIEFFYIHAWKIRRYFDMKNFLDPFKLIVWIFEWIYYIFRFKIDIVISKWGYVSLPMAIAWRILWKKVYTHETDTVTGIANKIISKLATKVFFTFRNDYIDNRKFIHSGPIIHPNLVRKITDNEKEENEKLNVLVIAWSQWSTVIFNSLVHILWSFPNIHFTFILWTKNLAFKDEFSEHKNATVFEFVSQEELWNIYSTTDIAITRWSGTLWELYFFWIHSIVIPLPTSAWNHQHFNALYFRNKAQYDILDEGSSLSDSLSELLTKYKDFRKQSLNLSWVHDGLNVIKKEIVWE